MTWKASGLNPQSRIAQWVARAAWWFVRRRGARLAAAGA